MLTTKDEAKWMQEFESPCTQDLQAEGDATKAQKSENFRRLHNFLETCLLRRTHSTKIDGKSIIHIPDVHFTQINYKMEEVRPTTFQGLTFHRMNEPSMMPLVSTLVTCLKN